MSPGTSIWLPFQRPRRPGTVRVFCLPHAGGGATAYQSWASLAPPFLDICPIQIPGRETRLSEPPATDVGQLVDQLFAALRSEFQPPFALFGHSYGALLAYELAVRMEQEGIHPVHLFASGRVAPHLPVRSGPLHLLSDTELLTHLEQFAGTPPAVLADPELRQLYLPILRADFQSNFTYSAVDRPPMSCGIWALRGVADPLVSSDEIEAWRSYTQGPFHATALPGGHFFVKQFAPEIVHLIARAVAPR